MSQPSLRPLLVALALLALTGCSPLNSAQKSNAVQAGAVVTTPRWYSVRPAFLRMASTLRALSMGGGASRLPIMRSRAGPSCPSS